MGGLPLGDVRKYPVYQPLEGRCKFFELLIAHLDRAIELAL
jgi:hypothetical protein